MDGMTLLAEARTAGLLVRAEGGRLVIDGPRAAAPVVERLVAAKSAVLAALADGRPEDGADAARPDSGLGPLSRVFWVPPRECFAPLACSRLDFCDRRLRGQPCTIATTGGGTTIQEEGEG